MPGIPVESEAGLDANARYPDFLSRRLARAGRELGVLNAGISGNRLLEDASAPFPYGRSALDRFHADVLDQPGVRDVIVLGHQRPRQRRGAHRRRGSSTG